MFDFIEDGECPNCHMPTHLCHGECYDEENDDTEPIDYMERAMGECTCGAYGLDKEGIQTLFADCVCGAGA